MRWHLDADGDGYGDPRLTLNACSAPNNYVANGMDCDDQDAELHPLTVWFVDADGDGAGAPPTWTGCSAPYGYVLSDKDCDDYNMNIGPDVAEICNDLDDDCDGKTDEEDDTLSDAETWFIDQDGDGYGQEEVSGCAAEDRVTESGDCNDVDPNIYPEAEESCTINVDQNCDGHTAWGDSDGDGDPACTDCNDQDPKIHTGVPEVCDGIDNDCNGVPDDAPNAPWWFADQDQDGYGNPEGAVQRCTPIPGFVPNNLDCYDKNPSIHPHAEDRCDGVDQNCDGEEICLNAAF